ncbi:hypothetical protein Scep_029825 [Stephania cephalantha]|uniref:Uncharacterized protein n=1 Tax=Stephania cephalantha TaxID=152367 RepID=A0AAP0HDU5_9MAGN
MHQSKLMEPTKGWKSLLGFWSPSRNNSLFTDYLATEVSFYDKRDLLIVLT